MNSPVATNASDIPTLRALGLSGVSLKRDRYRKARGGNAQLLLLTCARCSAPVLVYQKDGSGQLLRCYVNRIFWPEKLARLQGDGFIQDPSDLPTFECGACGAAIGSPIRHRDDRLAFRLSRGTFVKRKAMR